nr:hypothetical protein [Tanacetum cinerariifolium]
MMSFDYRLKPLYTIKECSSCGALYTTYYCCSNGSLVDKINCDPNKSPDSPHLHMFSSNKRHCFQCKDVLRDGEFCQRCTCMRCGSGLSKGLCLICRNNQNSLNDSPSISENSSQSPPISSAIVVTGVNFPSQVFIIPNPKPCNNQTIDELPQTLPSFDPTCSSGDGNSFTYDTKSNIVDDSSNVLNPPSQLPKYSYEFCENDTYYSHDCPPQVPFTYDPKPCYNQEFKFPQNSQNFQQQYLCCTRSWSENIQKKNEEEEKKIAKEQAAKARYWKIPICYDDDEDCSIAITPMEPDNYLSMGDEHL